MAADQEYIKARHRLIPRAMKITSDHLGIRLSSGQAPSSGEHGGAFVYASYPGDPAKVMTVFLATMDRLYAESMGRELEPQK